MGYYETNRLHFAKCNSSFANQIHRSFGCAPLSLSKSKLVRRSAQDDKGVEFRMA
jgi:hypothetical protein